MADHSQRKRPQPGVSNVAPTAGQRIRPEFAGGGNFVVDPEARASMPGMRLLGTYLAGKQDLSITDSANDTSRKLLKGLVFSTILPYSIHWARPLRPSHFAVHVLSHLIWHSFSTLLKFATKPVCTAVDSMATRFASSPFRRIAPLCRDRS